MHDPMKEGPAGWEHFGDYLKKIPGLSRFDLCTDIVIFCDASDDPKNRFDKVKKDIEAVSAVGPEGEVKYAVSPPGVTAKDGKPRLHIFLVPKVDGKGGLESLCIEAAAKAFDDDERTIMKAVDEFAGKVCRTKEGKLWSVEKADKLRLQAFVSAASPRRPETHFYKCLGIAGDTLIPLDSDVFDDIKKFLSAISALLPP
jgi:hypothetical protein